MLTLEILRLFLNIELYHNVQILCNFISELAIEVFPNIASTKEICNV